MTRQIPDILCYEGDSYEILRGAEEIGLHPIDYGIWPFARSTANNRGFFCAYSVDGGVLVLKDAYISSMASYCPPINGVEAKKPHPEKVKALHSTEDGPGTHVEERQSNRGYFVYEGVNLPMRHYSGILRIGKDMDAGFCRIVRWPPVWMFETVVELEFEDGFLRSSADISQSFVEMRKEKHERAWTKLAELLEP